MMIKLAGVIFILLIKLVDVIFALLIKVLEGVILTLLLKGLYIGDRAGRYHLCSINKSVSKCYPHTTIESY